MSSLAAAMTHVRSLHLSRRRSFGCPGGLNLVISLIKETLPSWFNSRHRFEQEDGELTGSVALLRGYALAYFTILCGTFPWGIDSASRSSRQRPKVLGSHLEFLASALNGKVSLGFDRSTWRMYVVGYVGPMVACMPLWVVEVDVGVLRSLNKGLRCGNEEELVVALLGQGGVKSLGSAAERIFEIGSK